MKFHRALGAALVSSALTLGAVTAVAPTAQATPATACIPAFTPETQRELAELTDPSSITTYDDARETISELRKALGTSDNHLGTFPIAFDNILELVGPSIEAGIYEDPKWATDLTVEVVRLYVTSLHEHLTGGTPEPHWAVAFGVSADCDRSPGRALLGQIFAHLVVDFPYALENIDSTPQHTKDFYTFGTALVDATPSIVDDVERIYGVDLEPLFTAWFLGDIIGDSETTTLLFQSTRTAAWLNNFGLQNPATRAITTAEIDALFHTANFVLDQLENLNQI